MFPDHTGRPSPMLQNLPSEKGGFFLFFFFLMFSLNLPNPQLVSIVSFLYCLPPVRRVQFLIFVTALHHSYRLLLHLHQNMQAQPPQPLIMGPVLQAQSHLGSPLCSPVHFVHFSLPGSVGPKIGRRTPGAALSSLS